MQGVPVGGVAGEEVGDLGRREGAAPEDGPPGIPPRVPRFRQLASRETSRIRMANYLTQAQQKWTIAPVTDAGGYPGSPYFKITIAGTDRALAATEEGELVDMPVFHQCGRAIWRIDQLADGSYRIMPKAIPEFENTLAVSRRRQQLRNAGEIRSRQRKAALVAESAVSFFPVARAARRGTGDSPVRCRIRHR